MASKNLSATIKKIEQRLLASIVESSEDGIISKTLDGIITSWNPGAENIFGYQAKEVIGKPISILFPADRLEEEALILKQIAIGETVYHFETVRIRKDGTEVSVSVSNSPIKNLKGEIIGSAKIVRDITNQKKLELNQLLLTSIIESSDDAIISKTLNGIITSWNQGAEKIFGYKSNEVIGKPISILIPPSRLNEEVMILEKIAHGERVDHFETVRIRKDGTEVYISVSVSPMKNSKGEIIGASKIARDITQLSILSYLAYHDALTGLPTLRTVTDRLKMACNQADRSRNKVAVIFVDIDEFKAINDKFGHTIGDNVLKVIAKRLVKSIRSVDSVARVGGDEFLVIITDVNSYDNINKVCFKILNNVQRPITKNNQSLTIGLSMGISVYPDHTVNMNELLKKADEAMYGVKNSGKNNFALFPK